ncbi:MAG: beta-ketoacyl synthase N-terminal-like domain-containing protein, partial [Alphaproteobacteria bacterium]
MRRVVVTGVGAVTPLGVGVQNVWNRLLNSESGAGAIQSFDVDDLTVKIACQVPIGDSTTGSFNPDEVVPPKDQRKMDDFIIFAIGAADEA